eukprot:gene8014-1244_t
MDPTSLLVALVVLQVNGQTTTPMADTACDDLAARLNTGPTLTNSGSNTKFVCSTGPKLEDLFGNVMEMVEACADPTTKAATAGPEQALSANTQQSAAAIVSGFHAVHLPLHAVAASPSTIYVRNVNYICGRLDLTPLSPMLITVDGQSTFPMASSTCDDVAELLNGQTALTTSTTKFECSTNATLVELSGRLMEKVEVCADLTTVDNTFVKLWEDDYKGAGGNFLLALIFRQMNADEADVCGSILQVDDCDTPVSSFSIVDGQSTLPMASSTCDDVAELLNGQTALTTSTTKFECSTNATLVELSGKLMEKVEVCADLTTVDNTFVNLWKDYYKGVGNNVFNPLPY